MATPKLEGMIVIATGAVTMDIVETGGGGASATVTLTAGTYSMATLCAQIASDLTGNATLNGTYSCSMNDGAVTDNGKTVLSVTGVTSFTLTWGGTSGTAIRNILGFTGNLTPTAASFTSSNHNRMLWIPTVGRTKPMGPEPTSSYLRLGVPFIDSADTFAPAGPAKFTAFAQKYKERLEWFGVPAKKTWRKKETVTNESFESFYDYVIYAGKPVRYYPDQSNDAVYATVWLTNRGAMLPPAVNEDWVDGDASIFSIGPYDTLEYV